MEDAELREIAQDDALSRLGEFMDLHYARCGCAGKCPHKVVGVKIRKAFLEWSGCGEIAHRVLYSALEELGYELKREKNPTFGDLVRVVKIRKL